MARYFVCSTNIFFKDPQFVCSEYSVDNNNILVQSANLQENIVMPGRNKEVGIEKPEQKCCP